jgi:RNA polymerase sigma-70 factor, ECF subfamily
MSTQTTLEPIWEQYCCRLLRFIQARVDDETEAEDILQEVFLRVHQNLCCLPQPSRLEAWIYQITRNLIIDHYRKRKALAELPDDLAAAPDFLEDDPQARLALSLQEMIEQLPAIYRQALILTEYQGMSQKELAEQLGISFSGAKSRVQRARLQLKNMFLACCHFELDRHGGIIEYQARCCCCKPPR